MNTDALSTMNPAYTNQCMIPTQCHCSIRVWSSVSLSMVTVRRPGWSVRGVAAWPWRITPSIWRTARTTATTATTVMTSETTMAKICMERDSLERRQSGKVRRRTARGEPIPRGPLRQSRTGVRRILPTGNFESVGHPTMATFSTSVSWADSR